MLKLCCYPSFSHFCCMYKVRFLLNGKCVYVWSYIDGSVDQNWLVAFLFNIQNLLRQRLDFSIFATTSTKQNETFFKQWSNWANILIIENHQASPKVKVNIDEGYLENLLPTKYQFFCKLGEKEVCGLEGQEKPFFSHAGLLLKNQKSASTVMPWCDIGHTKSIKQCIFNFSSRILLKLKLFQGADIGNYRHEL